MRFAFCAYKIFPYGGLSRDMLRVIDECQRRGHELVVYCSEWQGPLLNEVEVRILRCHGLTNHTRAAAFHRRLQKHLAGEQFDAIIGFNKMPGLDIYYAADYCYVGRAISRHRVMYLLTSRYRYYGKFERAVFGVDSNTKILCLSEREKSIYQQFYQTPDNRLSMLPANLDKQRLTEGVKAFLMVVGQDNAKPFRRLARRLGILDRVHFLGGRSDVPELLHASDLLIHPAYNENSGMILLEAITAGLPVLTTDACGYASHIECARAGRVLRSPFVQEALNRELARMLVSDERENWRRNGLAYRANPNLYGMPTYAVDKIEQWAREKNVAPRPQPTRRPRGPTLLWLRQDFQEALEPHCTFDDVMTISGDVYREAPGRRTLRFTRNGKAYFLKAHSGVGWREISKNLLYLRTPVIGARNEWHGIHLLRRLGIDTLCVVAYGLSGRNPARRRSFIVTEEVPATITVEEYCGQWNTSPPTTHARIRFKRWLIEKTAEIARTLHRNGANHRDFYLCHFLLKIDGPLDNPVPEKTAIYVIDLHRMQLRRRTPTRWLVKDIASLYYSGMNIGLTQRDLFRFMKVYDDRSLREIFANRYQFWRRVANRALHLHNSERRKMRIPDSSVERQTAVSTTIPH